MAEQAQSAVPPAPLRQERLRVPAFTHPLVVLPVVSQLALRLISSFACISNTLTDDLLRREIGIEKIGHRMRILSQLRQDALVLFQLELLYRSAKELNAKGGEGLPENRPQDDSLFVLPGRQQRHFKSVYTETSKNNNSMVHQSRSYKNYKQPLED